MMVWHVMQDVKPGHITSYKTGCTWVESHDTEDDAYRRAERMNECCGLEFGVEYKVVGPVDEEIEFPGYE